MAAKKKAKRGSKSKTTASKKVTKTKRAPAKGAGAAAQKSKKKSATKARRARAVKPAARKKTIRKGTSEKTASVDRNALGSRSGLQSGDLQGVRSVESADSQSVDELLEEGNALEADIVTGVEQAEDDAVREVRTHEVPEDDVPEEYLDKE